MDRSPDFREPKRNVYVDSALTVEEATLKQDIISAKEQIESLKRYLETLLKSCKHEIKHDVPGFPYDTRYCSVCGRHLETI